MFNEITLIGFAGNDPELRYTPDGTPVTNVRLGTSEVISDKGGQRDCPQGWKDGFKDGTYELTTWFDVTFWRGTAETIAQYVKTGQQLFIKGSMGGEAKDGKMEVRVWKDKNDKHRASHEVTARMFKFLGKKGDNGNTGRSSERAAPPEEVGQQSADDLFRF